MYILKGENGEAQSESESEEEVKESEDTGDSDSDERYPTLNSTSILLERFFSLIKA